LLLILHLPMDTQFGVSRISKRGTFVWVKLEAALHRQRQTLGAELHQ
jgi:hypothetical protein